MTNLMTDYNEKDTPQTNEELDNPTGTPQETIEDTSINPQPDDYFETQLNRKEEESEEDYQSRLKELALKRHKSANELYSRLNRKKDELKEPVKKPEVSKKSNAKDVSEETILEQAVLLNQGYDVDDLKLLKKLQALSDEEISLTELTEDDVFKSHIGVKRARQEEEKKNLPPARGGNKVEQKPDFTDKETGRFDHKKHQAWIKEQMSK
jgi:hypothetical protein